MPPNLNFLLNILSIANIVKFYMQKTLLLVDGSNYLYRAFYALPNMHNMEGMPTGAIYGIISMLRRIRMNYPANFIVCIFDAQGKTFRNTLYSEYKATRKSMPEDLSIQLTPIYTAIRALGWPILVVEGVEADDVIGTLVIQATKIGFKSIIFSCDKDLAQLVNDHVVLINTMNHKMLDSHAVIAKFGIPPERIVDYLTLIGDTIDNIPGVKKCGQKTAIKWLTQYNSLDVIIANANKITGIVGKNLREALEWLPKARILITIKTNCDLSTYIDSIIVSLRASTPNNNTLREIFIRYNFRAWLYELDNLVNQTTSHTRSKIFNNLHLPKLITKNESYSDKKFIISDKYELILTEVQLNYWIIKINSVKLTAINVKGTSVIPLQAKLIGIALCCDIRHAAYIPIAHEYQNVPTQLSFDLVLAKLKPWLEDPTKLKLGQNIKYECHIFANYGIHFCGIQHDIMLESYVIESYRAHDIHSLALRYLKQSLTTSYISNSNKAIFTQPNFQHMTLVDAAACAAEIVNIILAVHQVIWPKIRDNINLRFIYEQIEIPSIVVLQKIEWTGVLIDLIALRSQSYTLGVHMLQIEQKAYLLAQKTFNLNSSKQLSEVLFDTLQLPIIKKTPSGKPSTNEEVLHKLAECYALPKILLNYRVLSKLKSTYTDKLPKMISNKTGRIHTNYSQAVVVTGRLASNDPNLQNIPIRTIEGRRIREAFIAPQGNLIVSADYSQIELRIIAHLSEDSNMLKAFRNHVDIHNTTAAEIFNVDLYNVTNEQRRYAKLINFGLIYGMSAFGLAANLGIELVIAQLYIEKYFQRFSGIKKYIDTIKFTAKLQGYVETIFGRRLWLPEINSSNKQRRLAAERTAINAPMQGTAADLIKLAMISVQNWLYYSNLQSKILMQVHDELVLEVPLNELQLIKETLPELMKNVAILKVPLITKIGIGQNWGLAH